MIFNASVGPSVTTMMNYVRGPGQSNDPGRATLIGGQGFGFVPLTDDDVKLATMMMEHNAKFHMQASPTKKCTLDGLHASLSWDPSQRADQDQMLRAGRTFLKGLGMENAMAVFHKHSDQKHPHMHMVASLIDPKTGLTFDRYQFLYRGQHQAIKWERDEDQVTPARQPQHDVALAAQHLDWERLQALLHRKDGKISHRKIDHALALGGHFGPHMVTHRVAFKEWLTREPHLEQETKQMEPTKKLDRQTILEQEVAKLEAQYPKPTVKSTVLDFFDVGDDDVHRPRRERGPQEINGNFKDMTDATTPGLLPPKRNKERGLER